MFTKARSYGLGEGWRRPGRRALQGAPGPGPVVMLVVLISPWTLDISTINVFYSVLLFITIYYYILIYIYIYLTIYIYIIY